MRSIRCRYCKEIYTGLTRREAADKLQVHVEEEHPQEHEDTRFGIPPREN